MVVRGSSDRSLTLILPILVAAKSGDVWILPKPKEDARRGGRAYPDYQRYPGN
jgi:hypothetical protein